MNVTVRKFAEEVVGPKVEAMDEAENMDPSVIKALFEQGVSDPAPPPCGRPRSTEIELGRLN